MRSHRIIKCLLLLACLTAFGDGLATSAWAQCTDTLYVDWTAPAGGNGLSWATAHQSLNTALNIVAPTCSIIPVTTILIAEGTYKTAIVRSATFELNEGTSLYGGYQSGGGARDPNTYVTILSGDIGFIGTDTDNIYNVVTADGSITSNTVLDGLTIRDGYADGGGAVGGGAYCVGTPTFSNVRFANNHAATSGGAVHGGGTFTNAVFDSNSANSFGGALYIESASQVAGAVFTNNTSGNHGAAIFVDDSCDFTNATFEGNSSTSGSSLFFGPLAATQFSNGIVWDNTASGAILVQDVSASLTISYSIVEDSGGSGGGWLLNPGADGGNNIDTNPLFVNQGADDLRITETSPAFESGNNAAANLPATDVDGNPRISGFIVDRGAYEYQIPCPPGNVIFVDATATGADDGTSWADAYTDLQSAITATASCSVTEIHVAQGTYVPGGPGNRGATFQLQNGVAIMGGYPNGGGTRDPDVNVTILSGDISSPPDANNTDNSYHVMSAGSGINSTAVVDGFTIRDGYANGGGSAGGAVFITGAGDPTFNDVRFVNNFASGGGGAVATSAGTFTNVLFDGNEAGGNGGAITATTATVTDAVFSNNEGNLGGAAFGGGTYLNVVFESNSASSGGAFLVDAPTTEITNAEFTNNTASTVGGAILIDDPCTLTNVTFEGNTNNVVYVFSAASTITNSIFWGNPTTSIVLAGGTLTTSYSLVQGSGGSGGSWPASFGTDGGDNIDADPLFVDAAAGNLRLTSLSPARDTGDNSAPNLATTNLGGGLRISGFTVDMGAREFQIPCSPVLHVAPTFGERTGDSWSTAFSSLQLALRVADQCSLVTEIRVAAGSYSPGTDDFDPTDPLATFQLREGVALSGGYNASNGSRDPDLNITNLNGSLQGGVRSYHVVTAGPEITSSTVVSGFTIRNGRANAGFPNDSGGAVYIESGGSPSFVDMIFENNEAVDGGAVFGAGTFTNVTFNSNTATDHGGAIYASPTETVFVSNARFTNNSASQRGGAIHLFGNATLENVWFENNDAVSGGACYLDGVNKKIGFLNAVFLDNDVTHRGGGVAIQGFQLDVDLINATFHGNTAASAGDALRVISPNTLLISNSIFWRNGTPGQSGIENFSPTTTTITHSMIEGSGGSGGGWDTGLGIDGGSNIDADPLFVDAASGDLRLMALSPAREAGDNAAPDLPTTDLDGNPRISGPTVDMGAYEFQVVCPPANIVFVDSTATGANTGVSWTDAFQDLQLALITAPLCSLVTEIHVAEGTYVPGAPGDRSASFWLREGISLLGGYPNGGGTRDFDANVTILSGDISSPPDTVNTDNSYHVIVAGSDITTSTVVSGFTIRDGFADSATTSNGVNHDDGGGLFVVSGGHPTFSNTRFLNNYASGDGGAAKGSGTFAETLFGDNSSREGGALYASSTETVFVSNARFTNNSALLRGGAIRLFGNATLENVWFENNDAATGGACYLDGLNKQIDFLNAVFLDNDVTNDGGGVSIQGFQLDVDLINATFHGNTAASVGDALRVTNLTTLLISNSIFWRNGAPGQSGIENFSSTTTIAHTLVEGSGGSGGGWDPGLGIDGGDNIDTDPLFVDEPSGDLRLTPLSPAINTGDNGAPNLTLTDIDGNARISGISVDMGAYEFETGGIISSITDVAADQGRAVQIQWSANTLDVVSSAEPITQYSVWRRMDAALKQGVTGKASPGAPEELAGPLPPGVWDFVSSLPATNAASYSATAPTLCDSTVVSGDCWSTFLIRSHTQYPWIVYESAPDSGYSVDNLAPAAPVLAEVGLDGTATWDASPDADFDYFTVYSVADIGTPLDQGIVLATTSNTSTSVPDSTVGTYVVVTATDFSGNEGAESNRVRYDAVSSVGAPLPTRNALYQNAPNPFNPATRIAFDVATPSWVTLSIYDVSGRLVRTLINENVARDRYNVSWNGIDANGRSVASGVYIYRLTVGDFKEQRKMLLMK